MEKINTKSFKKYLGEKGLDNIYKEMLLALVVQANEIQDAINQQGNIIVETSREGNKRYKQNPLIPGLLSIYATISRILKQNNLALSPEKIEVVKEVIEDDEFTILQNKLNNL